MAVHSHIPLEATFQHLRTRWFAEQGVDAPLAPGSHPLWGHMSNMRANPLPMMLRAREEVGDLVHLRFPLFTAFLASHPHDAEYIMLTNHRNYHKKTRGYLVLREILGEGMLTNDGASWFRQRRIAQPAFHRRRLAGFVDRMARAAHALAQRWLARTRDHTPFDVAEDMMQITLEIVSDTMLSADIDSSVARDVNRIMAFLLPATRKRIQRLPFLDNLPLASNKRFFDAVNTIKAVVEAIINERRHATGEQPDDLLTMLMEARDEETGEGMTDVQLRDEVMTIFLAGHETTANGMAWLWAVLSKYPEVQQRVVEEAEAVLNGRLPTAEDLPKLVYTGQVIDELLRIYPPVWAMGRTPLEDDVLSGYHIPAGSFVFLSPYVTHRHPEFWDNPEGFDPDRFEASRRKSMHRYQYFPFARGPRQCIGNNFALMEMKILLIVLARQVRLDLVPGQSLAPQPAITLRPRDGVWVRAHARQRP